LFGRLGAVVAVGIVFAGLAGCDAQPGVAARGDGWVITEQEVIYKTEQVNQLLLLTEQQGTASSALVLSYLVVDQLSRQAVAFAEDESLVERAACPDGDEAKDLFQQELGYSDEQMEPLGALDWDALAVFTHGITNSRGALTIAVYNGLVEPGPLIELAEAVTINPRYADAVVYSEAGYFGLTEPTYTWEAKDLDAADLAVDADL
jgi:hypothetical protein